MRAALLLLLAVAGTATAYDPLAVSDAKPTKLDFTVKDAKRGRDIPVVAYLTAGTGAAPVVLFSHGLGGTPGAYAYLGEHWARRGYVGVFLQHPGSDDGVWKDTPPAGRMAALKAAVTVENLLLRLADVPAVLDQLARWDADTSHPLAGRLDLTRVGMAGHSFGAVTTEAISGQAARFGKGFTDPRIKAAVVMSPSAPQRRDANAAFGAVKIPWLLLTGTADTAAVGEADVANRLKVFPALPPGHKYQLVLDGAEHSAFTGRALPGDKQKRDPNHHRAILAVTTAFWDATLKGDAAAKAWLDGDGVRGVLAKADKWEKK
jgi:predicted dienelactone hydrolase